MAVKIKYYTNHLCCKQYLSPALLTQYLQRLPVDLAVERHWLYRHSGDGAKLPARPWPNAEDEKLVASPNIATVATVRNNDFMVEGLAA